MAKNKEDVRSEPEDVQEVTKSKGVKPPTIHTVAELLNYAEAITGEPRHLVVGALRNANYSMSDRITQDELKQVTKDFGKVKAFNV